MRATKKAIRGEAKLQEQVAMEQPLTGPAAAVRARLQGELSRLATQIARVRDLMMFDDVPDDREILLMQRRNRMVGRLQEQVMIRRRILDAMEQARLGRGDELAAGEAARKLALDQRLLAGENVAGQRNQIRAEAGQLQAQEAQAANLPATGLPIIGRDPAGLENAPDFQALFDAFSGDVPRGSPSTPDVLPPDVEVTREFRTTRVLMPDGNEVEFWGFVDPNGPLRDGAYPSELIRIPENVLFHGHMKPRKGTHTIHWHGIEPTAMNDGVGKLSFEVTGSGYTYQWFSAAEGTYFYHCHHNTALHFEMGMVGLLIIDPPKPAGAAGPDAPYPTGGPGFMQLANEIVPYDVEALWFTDDVDPRWHEMSHDQGLGLPFGENAGQNLWDPKYFLITGRPHPWSRNLPTDANPGVAATVRAGQSLLIRLVCGAYALTRNTLDLDALVTAVDGRTMGKGVFGQYSEPFPLPRNAVCELTPARRWDLLVRPTEADIGDHLFRCEFIHWSSGRQMGVAETMVHVVP